MPRAGRADPDDPDGSDDPAGAKDVRGVRRDGADVPPVQAAGDARRPHPQGGARPAQDQLLRKGGRDPRRRGWRRRLRPQRAAARRVQAARRRPIHRALYLAHGGAVRLQDGAQGPRRPDAHHLLRAGRGDSARRVHPLQRGCCAGVDAVRRPRLPLDRECGGRGDGGPEGLQEGGRGGAAQGEGHRRLCAERRQDRLQAVHVRRGDGGQGARARLEAVRRLRPRQGRRKAPDEGGRGRGYAAPQVAV
mmetsp:Transcript_8008/g.23679  ORF Transcript_8008/g.23679 Transcript_8008/m.23679 type:complete len:248 (-) Transcript_8008:523-1266(-)